MRPEHIARPGKDELLSRLDTSHASETRPYRFVKRHDFVDQKGDGADGSTIHIMEFFRRPPFERDVGIQDGIGRKDKDHVPEDFLRLPGENLRMAFPEGRDEVVLMKKKEGGVAVFVGDKILGVEHLLFLFVESLFVDIAQKSPGLRNGILLSRHALRRHLIDIVNIACLFQAGALWPEASDDLGVFRVSHMYSISYIIKFSQQKRGTPVLWAVPHSCDCLIKPLAIMRKRVFFLVSIFLLVYNETRKASHHER